MLIINTIYKLFIQDRVYVASLKQSLNFKYLCCHLTHKHFIKSKKKNFLNKNSNRSYFSKFSLNRFNFKKYSILGLLSLKKK